MGLKEEIQSTAPQGVQGCGEIWNHARNARSLAIRMRTLFVNIITRAKKERV